MVRARWAAGALLALGYAIGSHALMTRAGDSPLALLVVLGPLVGLGLLGLWGTGHRLLAATGAVACTLLALLASIGGHTIPARVLYVAQHAGIHLALALGFGCTLRPGAQALISALARRVHGQLTPAMAAYTRRLTAVWVGYFLAMAVASVALFVAGDFGHWSLFANILTPVFTGLMFLGEYLLRYRLHPEFERVSLSAGLRAWQDSGRRAKPGASKAA